MLTLGAGREVLPHNMAVTKDADDIYTRPLAIRMRYMCIYACAVLLIGGRAVTRGLHQLAESRSQGSYTARGSRYSPCGTISGASKVRRAVKVSQC